MEPSMALVNLVSVITPVFNCAPYLDETFESILAQTYRQLQICIYDDGSTDDSVAIIKSWLPRFSEAGFDAVFTTRPEAATTRGAAYARNRAIESATGAYLCLLDADDIMQPTRIQRQFDAAVSHPRPEFALIGSRFIRRPEDATPRYTRWLNTMTPAELWTHRFRENTLIQPTFFMARAIWDRAGPYEEGGPAEDLKVHFNHRRLFKPIC